MLLGIFLYNGTMFYELKNGTLVETKDAQGNFDLTQVLGNKYLEDVDSEKCVIVDTYSNRCFIISKDLLHHGVSEEVYHKMLDSDETDSNKSSEEVTFILTITYKCNMHCTYCYQQNDKTLEKKLRGCQKRSERILEHRFYELTHVSNARHSITWLDRRSVRILRLIRTVRLFRFGHTRLRCWQVFRLSGKAGDSQ